jgi:methionyl-tRNA synthetase
LKWGELAEGTAIGDVVAVFPRLDKARVLSEINEPAGAAGASLPKSPTEPGVDVTKSGLKSPPPVLPAAGAEELTSFIEIDDFAKVDLRAGQVLSAERLPKSDKLLLLKIDLGEEQPRQVLAGIAQYYEPEKLVGRKVVVVANLKPRKLRGFESQGMVVAASYGEEGRPVLATFTEDVPNGARLK